LIYPLDNEFIILSSLSAKHLTKTLNDVQVLRTTTNGVDASLLEPIDLKKAKKILEQHLLEGALDLWSMFNNLSIEHVNTTIGTWRRQKDLLLLNMYIWEWLSEILEDAYDHRHDNPSSGIKCLLLRVETILQTRPTNIHLDAADFLSCFTRQEAVFNPISAMSLLVSIKMLYYLLLPLSSRPGSISQLQPSTKFRLGLFGNW
jgi:hypothetical protein